MYSVHSYNETTHLLCALKRTARSIQLKDKDGVFAGWEGAACSLAGAGGEGDQCDQHYAAGRLGTQRKGVTLKPVGI